jgi:hypothetical protein
LSPHLTKQKAKLNDDSTNKKCNLVRLAAMFLPANSIKKINVAFNFSSSDFRLRKDISISNQQVKMSSYTGVFLCEKSKVVLEKWWVAEIAPLLPNKFMDHMTVKFAPSREESDALPVGSLVSIVIVGYGLDAKGHAVVVHCPRCRSTNAIAHITVSTANDTRPAYSNELLMQGWIKVDNAPTLFGYVQDHSSQDTDEVMLTVREIDEGINLPVAYVVRPEKAEIQLATPPVRNEARSSQSSEAVLQQLKERLPSEDFIVKSANGEYLFHKFVLACRSDCFHDYKDPIFVLEHDNQDDQKSMFEIIFWMYYSFGFIPDFSFHISNENITSFLRVAVQWKIPFIFQFVFEHLLGLIVSTLDLSHLLLMYDGILLLLTPEQIDRLHSFVFRRIEMLSPVELSLIPKDLILKVVLHLMDYFRDEEGIEKNLLLFETALRVYFDLEKQLMIELRGDPSLNNKNVNRSETELITFSMEELISSRELQRKAFSTKWGLVLKPAITEKERLELELHGLRLNSMNRYFYCDIFAFIGKIFHECLSWSDTTILKEYLQADDCLLLRRILLHSPGKVLKSSVLPLLSKIQIELPAEILLQALCERTPKKRLELFHKD